MTRNFIVNFIVFVFFLGFSSLIQNINAQGTPTLSGVGTIKSTLTPTKIVTVNPGGVIAPGNGYGEVGTLSINSNILLDNAKLRIDTKNGMVSLAKVIGNATLKNGLSIDLVNIKPINAATIFSASSLIKDNLNLENVPISLNGQPIVGGTLGRVSGITTNLVEENNTLKLSVNPGDAESLALQWIVGSGTWNLVSGNVWALSGQGNKVFLDGDYALFNKAGVNTVTIPNGEQRVVSQMDILGGNWIFNGNIIAHTDSKIGSNVALANVNGRVNIKGNSAVVFNGANQFNSGISSLIGSIEVRNGLALGRWKQKGAVHAHSDFMYSPGILHATMGKTIINIPQSQTISNHFVIGDPLNGDYTGSLAFNITKGKTLTIRDVKVNTNNSFLSIGGAININSSNETLTYSGGSLVISNNLATYGGGIGSSIEGSNQEFVLNFSGLESLVFSNNSATTYGGAIYSASSRSSVYLGNNVSFINNKALTRGSGGAIFLRNNLSIKGNTFFQNNIATSGEGGAIYMTGEGTTNSLQFNADKGDIVFSGNKSGNNIANSIYLNKNITMSFSGSRNVYYDDPVNSSFLGGNSMIINMTNKTAFIQFANNDSYINTKLHENITGKIEIQKGTLRLASKNLNASGGGAFYVGKDGVLAGQGTFTNSQFTIAGEINPDADQFEIPVFYKNVFEAGRTEVDDSKSVGTITFSGNVKFESVKFNVDLKTGNSSDLINIIGTMEFNEQKSVINLKNLSGGTYILMSARSGLDATKFDLLYSGAAIDKNNWYYNLYVEGTQLKLMLVERISMTSSSITSTDIEGTYTGEPLAPEPVVKYSNTILVKDVDYTLEYLNNTNAGTATVVLTGKDKYKDQLRKDFTIHKATQSIIFKELSPKATSDPDFDPQATSSSGLPITYTSSNTKVATIVNNKIHTVAPGITNIVASQTGNANYLAASSIGRALSVFNTRLKSVSVNLVDATFENNQYVVKLDYTTEVNIIATPIDTKSVVAGQIGKQAVKPESNLFTITVTAEDNTVESYTLNVIVNWRTGIEDVDPASVKVYPNPVTSFLNIDSELEVKEVRVFDTNGKVVYITDKNVQSVDMNSYSKGMYLVKIKTTEKELTFKIYKE